MRLDMRIVIGVVYQFQFREVKQKNHKFNITNKVYHFFSNFAMMRTAVVILNWNTKDFLERFLPGLAASMPAGAEVVVADNGSTDGSLGLLDGKFHEIKQIRLDKNYGFTGGYNRAFKALKQMPDASDLEYFLLINSDIWATGACLMVRASEYERMGGLDERFFAHMEEIDLCWRLQLEGKSICVVPESVVYHVGGGTLPNDSPWKLKLNYRNNLLMLSNNLAKTYALTGSPGKAVRKARRTIFLRKCLDGCSALVYLLTGKTAPVKAVIEAHKEFRQMVSGTEIADIQEYQESHQGITPPELFPGWIVFLAMTKGNRIFAYLRKKI